MKFDKKKLKKARQESSLTIESAAEMLNMTTGAYWRVESGEAKLKVDQLIAFMNIFDKPFDYFFESENQPINSLEVQIEDIERKLDAVYAFIKEHPEVL